MAVSDFQRARSPEQQQQRRRDILDAARTMLEQVPLAEISLRELSRRVGLSKSNVVRYFPTREAVFLTVLVEDWDRWLDHLAVRCPTVAGSGAGYCLHALVAAAIAETLADAPRLCDLIANSQIILERHVPADTAREFKAAAAERTTRLARLVVSSFPGLGERDAFEVAGVTWALTAGAWPMAHPGPTVARVLAEPAFAGMRVDFAAAMGRVLTWLLHGMQDGSCGPS